MPDPNHRNSPEQKPFFELNETDLPVPVLSKRLLGNQLEITIQTIPQILSGIDIEAVHKTRVGFRRIRSQLGIVKPLFRKKVIQPFRINSRDAGLALGAVRDLDVFSINLSDAFQSRFPSGNFEVEIWQPFFFPTYTVARNAMLDHLRSQPFQAFIQNFGFFCQNDEVGIKSPEKISRKGYSNHKTFIESILLNQFYKSQQQQAELKEHPIDTNFHRLRIELKRFRYGLDFFTPLLKESPALSLIASLTDLQDDLGFINDCVTAISIIQKNIASIITPSDPRMVEFLYGYMNTITQKKEAQQVSFYQSWTAFQTSNPEKLLLDCFSVLPD